MVHIEDLVTYAIIAALGIAVLLLVTGKFIDLTVEKQTFTQTRSTINLLQKIVTDGPILVKDPEGNPKKLMIDKAAYGSGDLSECCDSVQYDYEFDVGMNSGKFESPSSQIYYSAQSIGLKKTNVKPKVGGEARPYSTADQCYYEFRIGNTKGAKVPVNICEKDINDNYICSLGVAGLETKDSPLSQLSSWMTQVCSSKFETSKRIPLAIQDYQSGHDITLEQDEKGDRFVCLDGNCKRFECPLPVETRVDQTLLDNRMGLYDYFTCNFVVISKRDNMVILYEGYDEAETAFPDAGDFPPNDEWTEDNYEIYTPKDSSRFTVTNEKTNYIDAAKGDKYITFKIDGDKASSLHDEALYLDMSTISTKMPEFSADLDCGGKTCVKMKVDGKVKYPVISYQARIASDSKKEPMEGQLTWKLYDTENNCIEKKPKVDIWEILTSFRAGQGKQIVTSKEWTPLQIFLLEKDQIGKVYQKCDGRSEGGDTSRFNWNIEKIEWNVCERVLVGGDGVRSCNLEIFDPLSPDKIEYLLIDDLRFSPSKEGYI